MSEFTTQGFLADYLAETGDHLQNIHQSLLLMEQSLIEDTAGIEGAIRRPALIDSLFRSFHTIKGLSGMVGLQPAAELSHALESVLADIRQVQVELTPEVMEALFGGVRLLEQTIQTLKSPGAEQPEIGPAIADLEALLAGNRPAPGAPVYAPPVAPPALLASDPEMSAALNPVDQARLVEALKAGLAISFAEYLPSAEKNAQGQNVGQAREALAAQGEIIKAIPIVNGSAVRFQFLVASSELLDPARLPDVDCRLLSSPRPAHLQKPAYAVPETVRVDLSRLDDLLTQTSSLVTTRARLQAALERLPAVPASERRNLLQLAGQMDRELRGLRRAIMRVRMVPLDEVFGRMPLAVRDLARASGKDVRLVIEGAETEIDKMLVERLLDPLLHLVRNAIAHGIETPAERKAAGKPPQGTLLVRGETEGDHILISVADNGRGIDFERVAEQATELGWLPEARPLTRAEALAFLCRPGFSTQPEATLGAGRGVGLDVVSRTVNEVSGALTLQTEPGQGSRFELRLPLSLVIVEVILFRSAGELFAIPKSAVDEVIEVDPAQVMHVESGQLYPLRDASLVLVDLAAVFRLRPAAGGGPAAKYALVNAHGDQRSALLVDQLVGLREVVVRPLTDPLIARPGISGVSELGDGQTVLVVDPAGLLRSIKRGEGNYA